jgi:hypothetical protein
MALCTLTPMTVAFALQLGTVKSLQSASELHATSALVTVHADASIHAGPASITVSFPLCSAGSSRHTIAERDRARGSCPTSYAHVPLGQAPQITVTPCSRLPKIEQLAHDAAHSQVTGPVPQWFSMQLASRAPPSLTEQI